MNLNDTNPDLKKRLETIELQDLDQQLKDEVNKSEETKSARFKRLTFFENETIND